MDRDEFWFHCVSRELVSLEEELMVVVRVKSVSERRQRVLRGLWKRVMYIAHV